MSKKQAIKTISLLWIGSLIGAGCAFLTQVILARQLGPTMFGAFSAALATTTLLTPLAGFGIAQYWLKAFGQEGWQAVRWLRGSFRFVVATTLLVLATLVAWAVLGPHDATTSGLLMVLSVYLLGQISVDMVSVKLQLEERYIGLAMWQFLPHLVRLLLVAMLAFVMVEMMTLSTVAYAYMFMSVGVFAVGMFLMSRMYRGHLALKGHGDEGLSASKLTPPASMGQVATQSWAFGMAGVFYLIYFQSNIILLKYICGEEAAGIYNVAFMFMAAVYMLPSVVYQKFLLPKIHRWANHDREKFYQVYSVGNLVMLLLGLLAMLAIWLLAPWGVQLLFGDRYINAILPLGILALSAPIRLVAFNVGSTLVTNEHMRRKVWFMAITALINLTLNVILIPLYGVNGAAIGTVISDISLLFLYMYSAKFHIFINKK
jgi:O-antigen/teichoic acid export membrane protein